MFTRTLVLAGLAAAALPAAAPFALERQARPPLLDSARQLLLVITPGWNDVRGELRRYTQPSMLDSSWRQVGGPVSIVVGRNGQAWDPLASPVVTGPQKAEGDGRSPAGVFALGGAFGFAPPAEAEALRLPYLQVTEGVECVDDVSSSVYNQIVDRRQVAGPDWTSSEKMREIGEPYRWGVVVNYNTPAVARRGSCIFLHIGGGEGSKGTAGCTAMPAPDLRAVMEWLDAAANPVLVQLPRAAYERVRAEWGLP
jgi:D-alanyl-D-alanine dipeptidase